MKLAFIVQRYGREILGGSETLARQLAERLSKRHEITVLTTTAKDYITWKNEYEPGEEKQRGVRLVRFAVEGERDIDEFNKFSEEIYNGEPTREQELEWLKRQGPVCPTLVEYLEKEHENFDLLVFFTYLYYPTFYGLQVAPEKSVLVPTAHDEPPLKLSIFKEMFQLPGSFLFNTEAEELLVLERFPVHKKMRETIGMGMELLDQPDPSVFRKRHNVSAKYFLYAGRIDGGKGLEELFRYFTFYKEENPASGNLELMLIGKLGMKLPDDKSIRYAGFVDEAEKLSAMAGAVAVLQPSKMESLSIVTLEAFAVGTPVVANAASRVLIDHCRKANAGFYYHDFEEFEGIVSLILSDANLGRSLGKNGQRYIKDNYGWQKLLTQYELALRSSGRPLKEPKPRRRDRDEAKDEATRKGRDRSDEQPSGAGQDDAASSPEMIDSAESPEGAHVPESSETPETADTNAKPRAERPEPREPRAREGRRAKSREESPRPEAAAVSESADPDATVGEVEAIEARSRAAATEAESVSDADTSAEESRAESIEAPSGEPSEIVEASVGERSEAGTYAEPEQAAATEPIEPEPEPGEEEEEVEVEVSEDVAHLPSFFQAAIPARKPESVAPITPKPAEPKPEPPPPPPPPAPPADGGLPTFFRPNPTALSKAVPPPEPEPEEPEPDEPKAEEPESEESQPEAPANEESKEELKPDRTVE